MRSFSSTKSSTALALAACSLFATSASLAAEVPSPVATTEAAAEFFVEGTTWAGSDIWGQPFEVHFESNGRLAYKTKDGIWTKGSWSAKGESIYFEFNDKFVEHQGMVRGPVMNGSGTTKKGHVGNWAFFKMDKPSGALVAALGVKPVQGKAIGLWTPSEQQFGKVFQGSLGNTSVKLECARASSCTLATKRLEGQADYLSSVYKTTELRQAEDLGGLARAWEYARRNQASEQSKEGDGYALLYAQLKPLLQSNKALAKCADFNAQDAGSQIICELEDEPSTLLVFNTHLAPCSGGFCGYVMLPLKAQP